MTEKDMVHTHKKRKTLLAENTASKKKKLWPLDSHFITSTSNCINSSSVHMSITHLYRHQTLHITLLLKSSLSDDSLKWGSRGYKHKSKKRTIFSSRPHTSAIAASFFTPQRKQLIFAFELYCVTCEEVWRKKKKKSTSCSANTQAAVSWNWANIKIIVKKEKKKGTVHLYSSAANQQHQCSQQLISVCTSTYDPQ